jgi:hypothetical protein
VKYNKTNNNIVVSYYSKIKIVNEKEFNEWVGKY